MYLIIALIVITYFLSCIKVIPMHSRAILLRLGTIKKVVGPGIVFTIQPIDKLFIVNLKNISSHSNLPEAILKEKVKDYFLNLKSLICPNDHKISSAKAEYCEKC